MKLTTVTNVSLDGVTQGHRRIDAGTRREAGARDEESSGGFERFGIVLLTYPVVVGQGTRLLPTTGPDIALELVDLVRGARGEKGRRRNHHLWISH